MDAQENRRAALEAAAIRHCRVCLCTEDRACPGRCWWVAEDLCSICNAPPRELVCEAVDVGAPPDPKRPDLADHYEDFEDFLDDEIEEDEVDCGLMHDGQCVYAGTEWCDWDCGRLR